MKRHNSFRNPAHYGSARQCGVVQRLDINRGPPRIPEHALLEAILERAILDLTTSSDDLDRKYASSWIFDPNPRQSGEFTFPSLCEYLDLDPQAVRRAIRGLISNNQKLPRRRRPRNGYALYELGRKRAA